MIAPTDATEARAAVERTTGKLTESYQRWPGIHAISSRMDTVRVENHFADKIAEAFRGQ